MNIAAALTRKKAEFPSWTLMLHFRSLINESIAHFGRPRTHRHDFSHQEDDLDDFINLHVIAELIYFIMLI